MAKLVSIITPSYNCGDYIHRLLDSVLQQTYPKIEMFVVDDGSNDDTEFIVEGYFSKFTEKGYTLRYVFQQNQGQSAAINNGLKLVTGEYLVWPDADDFFKSSNSIEIMVNSLDRSGDQFAVVRCLPEYLNEDTMMTEYAIETNQTFNEQLFEDCLYHKDNYWFCSGGYVVNFNKLKSVIPSLDIYTEKNAGQNWQLLLPIYYKYRCITVPKVLYSVLRRSTSHSRGQYSTRTQINKKYRSYRNTIVETLKRIHSMPVQDKNHYIKAIRKKYNKLILMNNIRHFIHPIYHVIKPIKYLLKR